jgi:GNAT superfamily N-acetyltransferase
MKLSIHALTPDRWPDLVDLFGTTGPVSRCWCMYWRIGAEYRRRRPATNRAGFRKIVEAGPPPGLLAYAGDIAVGWCALTPRADLPVLDRTWRLKRVDDAPVWSLSCFYIRQGYRKRGVTSALIRAAIAAARRAGAPALEAYPLDGHLSPSSTSTGYATTFQRLGFKEVARRSPERPILRYELG